MDTPALQRAGRVIYDSPLSRAYHANSLDVPGGFKSFGTCSKCSQIWIPGVTCKVRKVGHRGNKRARDKKRKRIDKYLASVASMKTSFVPQTVQKLRYCCFGCLKESECTLTQPLKPPKPRAGSRKQKSPKAQTSIPSATIQTGLKLSDFML